MIKVAVVGATGYTGEELVKILSGHPGVEITSLTAKIDKPEAFSSIFPWAKGKVDLVCNNLNIEKVSKAADFIFLALPHRISMGVAKKFIAKGKAVIDLSADYRLKDVKVYKGWYGQAHVDKSNLLKAVYGLPELYKGKIADAQLIANPGCYPTSAILGCAPLLKAKLADLKSVIIDSKSGVTGAGRKAALALHFSEIAEDFKAYKISQHQHMPEIEQELSKAAKKKIKVTFVPHLLPINRGILSTIYMNTKCKATNAKLIQIYKDFYKDAPFVRVLNEGKYPQIKNVAGTNFCDIGIKKAGNVIIVVTAIDNLQKGASGQAVQNMNIMCGFGETTGLI